MTMREIRDWARAFSKAAHAAGITRISYRFEQLAGTETELIPSISTENDTAGRFARLGIKTAHREFSSVSVRITGEYEGYSGEVYTENVEDIKCRESVSDYITELIGTIIDTSAVSGRSYRDPADNHALLPAENDDILHADPAAPSHTFTDHHDVLNVMMNAYTSVKSNSKYENFIQFNEFMCSEKCKVIDIISNDDVLVHHEGISAGIVVTAAAESNGSVQTVRKVNDSVSLDLSEILRTADEAAAEASSMADAVTLESGYYPAVISADVMTELMYTYLEGFSMRYVRQGISKYIGRRGQKVACDGVTIREEPYLSGGIGNRRYDDEASPVRSRALIDRGVLAALIGTTSDLDRSGNAEDAGNGYRETARSGISTGVSNLILEWNNGYERREDLDDPAGGTDAESLQAGIGDGIYITACDGIFAGADPVSGDFALISRGYHIIDGNKADSIDQITIAGNFYEILDQIQDAADDYVSRLMSTGAYIAPSVRLRGLMVSGGK